MKRGYTQAFKHPSVAVMLTRPVLETLAKQCPDHVYALYEATGDSSSAWACDDTNCLTYAGMTACDGVTYHKRHVYWMIQPKYLPRMFVPCDDERMHKDGPGIPMLDEHRRFLAAMRLPLLIDNRRSLEMQDLLAFVQKGIQHSTPACPRIDTASLRDYSMQCVVATSSDAATVCSCVLRRTFMYFRLKGQQLPLCTFRLIFSFV